MEPRLTYMSSGLGLISFLSSITQVQGTWLLAPLMFAVFSPCKISCFFYFIKFLQTLELVSIIGTPRNVSLLSSPHVPQHCIPRFTNSIRPNMRPEKDIKDGAVRHVFLP
ncbi:hypothetical protein DL98DRAFT_164967 [Cadophora sp. DSE1049]|nr:hypothetical protein DL98DRAFT_164967 [Cadophora sp. DSE1049]